MRYSDALTFRLGRRSIRREHAGIKGCSDFLHHPLTFAGLALSFLLVPAADAGCPYANEIAWRDAVPVKYRKRAEFAFVKAEPTLPNVLLIGDSISMRYTAGVQKELKGVANVYRAPDNCRSTRQTLEEIETYLGTWIGMSFISIGVSTT